MKIEIYCHNCEEINGEELTQMQIKGPLHFNPDTKTQSQMYQCTCGIEVTVIILPE